MPYVGTYVPYEQTGGRTDGSGQIYSDSINLLFTALGLLGRTVSQLRLLFFLNSMQ